MGEFLGILLVILLGGALVVAVILGDRKRRKTLAQLAGRLGLGFRPSVDSNLHRAFPHSLFRRGRSRQASNTIHGTLSLAGFPVEVRMGDYQYTTGSGKHRQVHRTSYACFRLPFLDTPDLLIRKENVGDKILGGLGFDDIDFESEEFSRRFWVKSGDKRYAYDLIYPGMMEFLIRGPTPQVEIMEDICLVREGSGRWDPDTFQGAVGWFGEFLTRWPEHLVDQLTKRHGRSP